MRAECVWLFQATCVYTQAITKIHVLYLVVCLILFPYVKMKMRADFVLEDESLSQLVRTKPNLELLCEDERWELNQTCNCLEVREVQLFKSERCAIFETIQCDNIYREFETILHMFIKLWLTQYIVHHPWYKISVERNKRLHFPVTKADHKHT